MQKMKKKEDEINAVLMLTLRAIMMENMKYLVKEFEGQHFPYELSLYSCAVERQFSANKYILSDRLQVLFEDMAEVKLSIHVVLQLLFINGFA